MCEALKGSFKKIPAPLKVISVTGCEDTGWKSQRGQIQTRGFRMYSDRLCEDTKRTNQKVFGC